MFDLSCLGCLFCYFDEELANWKNPGTEIFLGQEACDSPRGSNVMLSYI